MRLQFGVIATLIAISIAILLLAGNGEGDALTAQSPSQQPNTTATISAPIPDPTPPPEPTVTLRLQLPEWVAGSAETVPDFYFSPSILDMATANIWHVTVPGRAPVGQPSPITVEILSWSPDSEALVGVSDGERTLLYAGTPGGDLRYWAAVDGSNLLSTQISWSPDGNLVAVGELIVDVATGETVMEIPAGSPIGWSADSRYYAITIGSLEEPRITIWDRDGDELREPFRANAGVWSTNGSLLAYRAGPRAGAAEVHPNELLVQDIASGEIILSTTINALDAQPVAWSPSDEYLVASVGQPVEDSEFAFSRQAHIIDLRSGMVTVEIASAWLAAWSSTGNTLIFTGNICAGFDIFTVQADGTGLTNHTASENLDLWPIWSPDGRDVVHVTYGEDNVMLVVRSIADGSNETLLSLPFDELAPVSWSPDGNYIAFRYGGGRGLCEASQPQVTEVKILG